MVKSSLIKVNAQKQALAIIHLLHNMTVEQSIFLADDFSQRLNLPFEQPALDEMLAAIEQLKLGQYIQMNDGYVGLSQKGGALWEKTFLIDWGRYFEVVSWFVDGKEQLFFYASSQATIQCAIYHSQGLLDDCQIQTADNWQPIYWKEPFDGFYIQKALDGELLPYFDDILPRYCQSYQSVIDCQI